MQKCLVLSLVLCVVCLGGCTTHYRVTDPTSGKEYYTTDWMAARYRMNGAVAFFDRRTQSEVTLQSSEVKTISKEEYDAAVAGTANTPYIGRQYTR